MRASEQTPARCSSRRSPIEDNFMWSLPAGWLGGINDDEEDAMSAWIPSNPNGGLSQLLRKAL